MTPRSDHTDRLIQEWSELSLAVVALERDIAGSFGPRIVDRLILWSTKREMSRLEHNIAIAVAEELTDVDGDAEWRRRAKEWVGGS